ncbi:MAG: hypothetical protein K9M56_06320 [Victivallales bacterium]|nr:hypothetical protein [Victivallales bacterium]
MENSEISIAEKTHKINNLNQIIMLNIPIIRSAWDDLVLLSNEYSEMLDDFKIAGMPFETAKGVISGLIEDIENSSLDIKNTVMELRNSALKEKLN